MLSRRAFLRSAGATALVSVAPGLSFAVAASGERRFVFIIQRGAADGLDTVIPYADPDYARLRGKFAIDPAAAIKLDGHFALNTHLPEIGKLYAARQALFVHAVASPYRDRSHFDAQNVLETGGAEPHRLRDGWLNRLAGMVRTAGDEPIAFAATVPVAMQGPTPVTSYAPDDVPDAPDDLMARVTRLYAADPQLHPLWEGALEARMLAAANQGGAKRDSAALGTLAASFLSQPKGPRIAMLETDGWDTHSRQAGRLRSAHASLDRMIGSLRAGLGPTWAHTTILVATEFGRTAAINGTEGTDHGTGAVTMLLGGAVQGGRVLGDWPGLSQAALYQARDLKPTTPLDAVIAGAAGEALGQDPALVARTLFKEGAATKPMTGLVRV